jgi:hypothetical protein
VGELVARNRLWPIIDYYSCLLCASPRKPEYEKGYSTCYACKQLRERYGSSLADLIPITYSARDWPLGKGLRKFKDRHKANPQHKLALRFGAVLSLFLEHQEPRLAPAAGFGIVMTVPSSKPVVLSSLERAMDEGWWTPALTFDIAESKEGFPRQRERVGKDRAVVEDKWLVDQDRVRGEDVLLLDDFVTSGGSIHSLAQALRSAGAASVTAVVLARNVGEDGEWIRPQLEKAVAEGHVWTPHQNKRDVLA